MKQNKGKECDGGPKGAVSGRGGRKEAFSEKAAFGQKLE